MVIREYGYEYDAVCDETLREKTQGKTTAELWEGAHCLRSGRDALKAIAREFEPCTVLLPALSCDSMVSPFRMYNHFVRFYRLNKDYSIDLRNLESLMDSEHSIFLYMDYFGKRSICDTDLTMLRNNHNVTIIEDRTHTLLQQRKSSFIPDYSVASIRKWLPVPDGGLLWGTVNTEFAKDTSFSDKRLQAQMMRHSFLETGNQELKPQFRKIFSEVSVIIDEDSLPGAMSEYTWQIIKNADFDIIRDVRKKNAERLISKLEQSPYIEWIQQTPGESDLYVAFMVSHRDEIQATLSAKGIFNTIIWPLSEDQRKACETARKTEAIMLAAPCDQRYGTEDMDYIGKEMIKVIEDVNQRC